MMMNQRFPDIRFTRNPILLSEPLRGDRTLPRAFSVSVGGAVVYTGHCASTVAVDVAEIAEAHVEPIPDPDGSAADGCGILRKMEDSIKFDRRCVTVVDELGDPLTEDFYAIPGGISPQNFRRLAQLDSDIFTARLLDRRRNFFLTTRTHGWRIVMDELELYPLAFVSLTAEPVKLKLRAVGTDFMSPDIEIPRGIYSIDIAAVRRKMATDYGYLASAFDVVYADRYLSCQIVIRDTEPEPDTALIRFRNSLGVFELLHLSGKRKSGVNPPDSEQDARRYDRTTGRYIGMRPRATLAASIDVDSGFRTADEMRFILDMAASEEVYIHDRTGWVRVVPTVEALSMPDPQTEPESLSVSFRLADDYDSLTADIADLKDFERPRIFSDQHTDEFN